MAFHIIADADTIIGFAFAGVPGTVVDNESAARAALEKIKTDRSVQVLVVSKLVAKMINAELTAHRMTSTPPFIVEIDDVWNTAVQRPSLESMIQEAVGIRIRQE